MQIGTRGARCTGGFSLFGIAAGVVVAACATPGASPSAGPAVPETPNVPAAPQLGKSPLPDIIAAMTREEKVRLVMGTGMDDPHLPPEIAAPGGAPTRSRVQGSAAETYPIARLGIPAIVLADGPAGLRIDPRRADAPDQSFFATAFPIASALASSWDPRLVEEVGQAIGAEVRGYGVQDTPARTR